ncbi:MAG: riboflavin synthase [Actinomycetota bacterium]
MFTGIVEDLGRVVSRDRARIVVRSSIAASDTGVGDSIAIDGVCLTVVARANDELSFDISPETFARTTLGSLRVGGAVNVERPATLASRLGGHLVQGHVDGVAHVTAVHAEPEGGARLSLRLPQHLLRFLVEKGSITLDGVSMTVAALRDDEIDVALIPHTLLVTTLGSAREGDPVNVEVDVMAKYVARNIEHVMTDGVAVARTGKERTA